MAFQMLTSMPLPVLQGIYGAGLQARKAISEDMYAWLTNNLRKSEGRPSIYMIEFADNVGRPLTYEDMLEVVAGVRQYMNLSSKTDIEFAVKVEEAVDDRYDLSPEEIEEIEDGEQKWCPNKEARERLEKFLRNLENLIRSDLAQNSNDTRRMPFVLRDIGYTSRGIKRLNAHLDLTITGNKFMVLFALVAKAKGLKYNLQGDFVFLGFRPEHAAAAEVLFSILAQSYTVTGKGFNSVQAGQSLGLNDQVPSGSWNLWQKDVLEETPVRENAAAERARFAEIEEEIRQGEREIVIQQIRALTLVKRHWDIIRRHTF